ncbi:MAG TPA: hypothetical protein VMY39_09575, partial [Planctomycetota bacterium]|nr:hypothetical protein [Planctomycetota bacterium]
MGKLRIDHVGSTWSFRTDPSGRQPQTPRDARTRNTVLLGLVLFAAFLWPVQLPESMPPPEVQRDASRGEFHLASQPRGKPIFLSIEMLLAERTPPAVKFVFMVPGLFGVAVVFLAFARWSVRGVALIVLWT